MAKTRSKKTSNRQSQRNSHSELTPLELGRSIRKAVVNRDESEMLFLTAFLLGLSECNNNGENYGRIKEHVYKWTERLISEVGRHELLMLAGTVAPLFDDETLAAVYLEAAEQIINAFPNSRGHRHGGVFYEGGVFYVPR